MEPENSVRDILDGVVNSGLNIPILVIGNNENKYGKSLVQRFKSHHHIRFIGAIYNKSILNDLIAEYR